MRTRLVGIGIVGMALLSILSACGSDSPTATPTATNAVEPTGELVPTAVAPTGSAEEIYPTATLWVEGQPTPPVNFDVGCRYYNPATLEFQDAADLRGELIACNSEFVWPRGYEFDAERYASSWEGPGGSEVGSGRSLITFFNVCAWGTAWLDATRDGDQESANTALHHIEDNWSSWWSDMPIEGETSFDNLPEKTALGDPGPIMRWVSDESCSVYYEIFRVNP